VSDSWPEIRTWRRAKRAELLSRRLAVSRAEKPRVRSLLGETIAAAFPELCHAAIGFYWPIKGEIDLRHLVRAFLDEGAEAALPVVTEKSRPLAFWAWQPRMKLARGFWNIPVPAEQVPLRPTALLVPLVGFDSEGYRLGYGGGYYDRTLAAMTPRPLTIGVGYELGRLESIHPQPHDIPLDAIVTEAGCSRFAYRGGPRRMAGDAGLDGDAEEVGFASPPCFLHELSPDYLGYMPRAEVIELLSVLLESERAGARGVAALRKSAPESADRGLLREVAMDEARFCAMLSRHIERLGGRPSAATGSFLEKLLAKDNFAAQVALLDRGQAWVAQRLREALPRLEDRLLQGDLTEMLAVHEDNIRRCAALG